jgi:O-antigen/teichoic acid export membrane protein
MADSRTQTAPVQEAEQGTPASSRFGPEVLDGRSVRQTAARGVAINAGFQIGLAGLNLARRFLIAIFLTAADYGLWGLIYIAVATILWLKDVGIGDKYIQQDEPDQELAFQKAFSLEVVWCAIFAGLILVGVPIFSVIYGRPEIIAPGCTLALVVLASGFTSPAWIFYRGMRFVQHRLLTSIEPVVGLIVTLVLGAAGFSYWSLVLGAVAGTWATAVACVIVCPYRLRWHFDRRVLKDYYKFSWPLVISSASSIVAVQTAMIVGQATVGLAGLGAIGLAGTIATFTDRVDALVAQSLYPAMCAVKDRLDVLQEAFTKSNRLGLVWGIPFGIGLTLFAPDVVTYLLGDKWRTAEGLLAVFGIACAAKQLAFNWTAVHRARGDTRPIAVNGVATLVTLVVVLIPGMILWGLTGYAVAICASIAVQLVVRAYYLGRLFNSFSFLGHSLRAIAPTIPAMAAVVAARVLESGDRTLAQAVAELVLYAVLTLAATCIFERQLLRELVGYLRGAPDSQWSKQKAFTGDA